MAQKHLATYLNDHLAGAALGSELLSHLIKVFEGQHVGQVASEIQSEVISDRQELEGLMARLEISQSPPRKASAWFAEKMSVLKLRMDDPAAGPLRLLEAVEAISLGVEGKRLLWRALAAASERATELNVLNYPRLIQRAEDQRSRLETLRLEGAVAALNNAS